MHKAIKRLLKERLVIRYLYTLLRRTLFSLKIKNQIRTIRKRNFPVIFIIATPCHGNIGDHAIVNAQKEIFTDNKKESIIEVSNNEWLKYSSLVTKLVKPQDIIIIDGGGNLGTLWTNEDDKIADIISNFNKNRVVIFPQTCYYDKSEAANVRLQRNKEIYQSHPDLTISLRDERSYKFFRKHFPAVESYYVPDIVLYSNYSKYNRLRKGALFCFRSDKEKILSDDTIQHLESTLQKDNISFKFTDTVVTQSIDYTNRDIELNKKLTEFASSSLVITDRLHGLIFAVITGTPCIAFDNVSKKVSGVATWFLSLANVEICSKDEDIPAIINKLYNQTYVYDNRKIKEELKVLIDKLQ